MAIKVPDEMVFYVEKDAQTERLLCWIPPRDYEKVAVDNDALKRLRRNYPRGIEIRVRDEEFEQEGIKLEVKSKKLVEAYQTLQADQAVMERGMVNYQFLIRKCIRPVHGPAVTDPSADGQPRLFNGPPKSFSMAGDEGSPEVFRRLSVRQMAEK